MCKTNYTPLPLLLQGVETVFNFPNKVKGRLEAPTGYVEIVDNQYLNDTKMTQKWHKNTIKIVVLLQDTGKKSGVFRVIKKGN